MRALLDLLARERGRLPGWLAWTGALGAWLWRRWWGARLLPGPDAAREAAELQARKLGALLGESYAVTAVSAFGEAGPEQAASWVAARETVVVLDLSPHGGALARARAEAARLTLERRGARPLLAPPLGAEPAWLEALAESARAAIADLPPGSPYEVVFAALDLPGLAPGQEADAQAVLDLSAALAASIGLERPYRAAFLPGPGAAGGSPGLLDTLLAASRRGPVILVPLNSPCEGSGERRALDLALAELARRQPQALVRCAPALQIRPTYLRALAAAVLAAEAAASPPGSAKV